MPVFKASDFVEIPAFSLAGHQRDEKFAKENDVKLLS
jgi:hypothetical protein